MTIDWAWLQANAWWLLGAGALAWWYLNKNGSNPLAGYKLPTITVQLTPEQLEQLKPKG